VDRGGLQPGRLDDSVTVRQPLVLYDVPNSANLVQGASICGRALGGGRRQATDQRAHAACGVGDPFIYDVTAPISPVTSAANNTYLNTAVDAGRVGLFSGVATDTAPNRQRGVQPLHARGRPPSSQEDGRTGTFWDPTAEQVLRLPRSSGNSSLLWRTATASLTDSMHLTWSFSSSLLASKLTGGHDLPGRRRTRDAAGNFSGPGERLDLVAAGAPPLRSIGT